VGKGKKLIDVFEDALGDAIDDARATAIYAHAVQAFGAQAQLAKMVEEMAELTVAIQHLLMGRDDAESAVIEEIADVSIMLGQMRLMFDEEKCAKIKNQKLQRLTRMIIEEGRKNGKIVAL